MTIEEKAKAYDEALKRAREWYNNSNSSSIGKSYLYAIFPELKESGNEDEKIRKEIINYFKCQSREEPSRKDTHNKWIAWLKKVIIPNHNDNDSSFIEDIKNVIDEAPLLMQSDKEKMIAWLEKQGEVESDNDDIEVEEKGIREAFNKIEDEKQGKQKSQRMISAEAKEAMYDKPADKVEPKFKVGDSIKTANEEPLTITEITDNGYWSEDLFICNFDDAAKWELVEQKTADKVESKFKVGDWVVYYRNDSSREVLQVYDIRDGRYYFTDNVHFSWSVKECDEKSHLWTIQDAKDGDVLAFKNNISGIIICKSPTNYDTRSYCRFIEDNFICIEEIGWDSTLLTPATKEQRDLLFKKIKEAGYEWDAEKKELKKIDARNNITLDGDLMEADCMIVEQKSDSYCREHCKGFQETGKCFADGDCKDKREAEQKSASWSKEDDVRLQACIDALQAESLCGKVDTIMTKWLKSLKERYTWKPSDEQIEALESATENCAYSEYQDCLQELIEQLKKLREE